MLLRWMSGRAALGSWLALSCAAAACASGPQLRAANPAPIARFDLQWNAAEGCMDRASARRAIAKSLQTPDAARGAVVRVTIANGDDGWNADVWMYGPRGSGERGVRGTSCKQVAEAVTLIVAMALDAAYVAEESPAPVKELAPEPAKPAALALGVTAAADTGSLPGITAGFGLSLALELERWRLEAEGTAWLPRKAPGGPVAGSGGSIGLYAGGLRASWDAIAADSGRLTFGPCLTVEAGAAVGRGYGVADPDGAANFWGAGLAGISLRYLGLGAIRLGFLTELGVPLHRPVWHIERVSVFQPAHWFGRASIRIGYLFR